MPQEDPLTGEMVVCLSEDPYAAEWFAYLKCYGIDSLFDAIGIQSLEKEGSRYYQAFKKIKVVGGVPMLFVANCDCSDLELSPEYAEINSTVKGDPVWQIFILRKAVPVSYSEVVKDSFEDVLFCMMRWDLLYYYLCKRCGKLFCRKNPFNDICEACDCTIMKGVLEMKQK